MPTTLTPGTLLAGKYLVERVLGDGAMGVVVAARHVDLHETRAIKLMRGGVLDGAEAVERFLREARAAVRLKSQHVCKALDVGRLEDGAPFIVMEYLEGQDLKALFESRGALPVPEAVTYALHALDALAEAHAAGIIHRDIKPANLFLTTGPRGEPVLKVLDFGIAKLASPGGPTAVEMTGTAEIIGTPVFMSPEQMRATRDVDGRADLWAIGVVLYRALTGRLPFSGSTITQVCTAVVADPAPPLSMLRPDIPPALEAIVLRCLEKSPEQRFQSAAVLAAALAFWAGDSGSPRRPIASLAVPEPDEVGSPILAPLDGSTSKHAALAAKPAAPVQSSSRVLLAAGVMATMALALGLLLISRALNRAPNAVVAALPASRSAPVRTVVPAAPAPPTVTAGVAADSSASRSAAPPQPEPQPPTEDKAPPAPRAPSASASTSEAAPAPVKAKPPAAPGKLKLPDAYGNDRK